MDSDAYLLKAKQSALWKEKLLTACACSKLPDWMNSKGPGWPLGLWLCLCKILRMPIKARLLSACPFFLPRKAQITAGIQTEFSFNFFSAGIPIMSQAFFLISRMAHWIKRKRGVDGRGGSGGRALINLLPGWGCLIRGLGPGGVGWLGERGYLWCWQQATFAHGMWLTCLAAGPRGGCSVSGGA